MGDQHTVKVMVMSAVQLAKKELFGQSDPYCKVWINSGEQEKQTAVKKKTLSPYWGEEFVFTVSPQHDVLHFQVFDHNRFGKDDFLGLVDLPLKDIQIPGPEGQMKPESFNLKPRSAKSRVTGSLAIKLQFTHIPGHADKPTTTDPPPTTAPVTEEGLATITTPRAQPAATPGTPVATSAAPLAEVGSETSSVIGEEPLPEGWEMREDSNGRRYYVDHNTRTMAWTRPTVSTVNAVRLCQNQEQRAELQQFSMRHRTSFNGGPSPSPSPQRSISGTLAAPSTTTPATSPSPVAAAASNNTTANSNTAAAAASVGEEPLPGGWELRSTPDGRVFYVDHNTRQTTWKDPRITMKNKELAQPMQRQGSNPNLGPLPPGWEERRTHDGRIFYVNHIERTTQWEDPRHQHNYGHNTPAQTYARDYRTKLAYFRSKLRQREGKVDITVGRENVFEDSFREIMKYSPDQLRKRLWVKFEGEDGLDYGGLAREWFYLLSHSAFSPYYGLFEYAASDIYTLQINPNSAVNPDHLQYFEFIGRVVGMSVFHGKLIDAFFIRPFYRKILAKPIDFEDMQTVDGEYYRSLNWMKENDITDVLDLTFSVTQDKFGELLELDLAPNGRNVEVTEANKNEYIRLVTEWRFSRNIEEQMTAFITGFNSIIPQHLIKIFDEKELELLIGGISEIDVKDWKSNTEYRNGYYSNHKTVVNFWEVVESFDNEMRARLLQFVTGTSRVPVNGFRELH
eukprot:Ihof_evm2s600 gene=Ihof_evmTU2s600